MTTTEAHFDHLGTRHNRQEEKILKNGLVFVHMNQTMIAQLSIKIQDLIQMLVLVRKLKKQDIEQTHSKNSVQ